MTDDELRAVVKQAIARHLGAAPAQKHAPAANAAASPAAAPVPPWRAHASFGQFLIARGADDDGACVVEPAVRCNHCGFCQSYGH